MENEDLITSFKTMIEELQNSQKELSEKLDGILNEAADAKRGYDKSQFVERNKDFFDKYRDDVMSIEGDDFDFDEVAYSGKGDMEETEYIAALSKKLDDQLNTMAKKLSHLLGEKVESVEAKAEDTDGDGETDTTEIETKPEAEPEGEAEEKVKETEEEEEPEAEEEAKPVEMDEDFRKRFAALH